MRFPVIKTPVFMRVSSTLEIFRERQLKGAAWLLKIARRFQKPMQTLVRLDPKVPLYNCHGMRIGWIAVSDAIKLHGKELELRAKGTGRRRRFTSAKLYARVSQIWKPRQSGGYVVLQLIME